jgi:regulator of protease activity HflC (stomatin/prohibitin superfamily)
MPVRVSIRVALVLAMLTGLSGCGESKERQEGRRKLTEHVARQIDVAKSKAAAFAFDDAKALLRELTEYVNQSPYADSALHKSLTADMRAAWQAVEEQESEFLKNMHAGWKAVDGKLVSPEDQARALEEQRRREEAKRARQEQEQARRLAEASAAEERKRQEEKKRRDQEEEQVRAKAKEMYPSYKKAAEALADEILKLLSAVEVGITYQDYTKRLQDVQFSYNKLVLANGGEESLTHYSSFLSLVKAVEALKLGGTWWKRDFDYSESQFENELQESWKEARSNYSAAMAALARNE